jgi:hypothetical protein
MVTMLKTLIEAIDEVRARVAYKVWSRFTTSLEKYPFTPNMTGAQDRVLEMSG